MASRTALSSAVRAAPATSGGRLVARRSCRSATRYRALKTDARVSSEEPMIAARTLDDLAYRTTLVGFPIWTFAIIAGAIWAQSAWSRYWGWDPKETWSFIVWTIFAAYLHARATAGWRARGAAWIAVIGLGAIIFNFYVVNTLLVGLHSYSGL